MEINIIPKFIDEAAGPPAKAVGNTLTELWDLGIGNHISLWSAKQKIRQEQNLQEYKNSLENKIQAIPEDNLIQPKMHLVGPALEASKYYIESEALREMFANLVASSIDNRKNAYTHPSFIEIIKQISPDEAKILKKLQSKGIGILNVYAQVEGNSKLTLARNFSDISYQSGCDFPDNITMYLDNLDRLSLIKLDTTRYLVNTNVYEDLQKYPLIQTALQYANELGKPEINQGYAEPTLYGVNFYKSCIE